MSKTNWIEKLEINVIDEEDGSHTIRVDWDDTDPDLELWNSWGDEGRKAFVLESLQLACSDIQADPLTKAVDS